MSVCVQEHGQQAGAGSEAVLVGEDGSPWQDTPAPLPQPCQGWPHPHHTSTSTAYVMCASLCGCQHISTVSSSILQHRELECASV